MTNESLYPWFNPTKKYSFYVVVLKQWSDTLSVGTETLLTAIQMAFSTNRWSFDMFLSTYKNYIDVSDYNICEMTDGLTWGEFCEFIYTHYSKYVGQKDDYRNYCIDVIQVNTLGRLFPVTPEMYRKVEEDEYTSGVESLAIPLLIETRLFIIHMVSKGYIQETSEIKVIKCMLDKIFDIYITLYLRCINWDYSDNAESGEWFLSLPDAVKIELTRRANFPMPLETIEWNELMTEDFNLCRWLEDIVGYPDVEDTGEKHSTFGSTSSEQSNKYASMVTNYTAGWGLLTS